jgi:beta-galactosidase
MRSLMGIIPWLALASPAWAGPLQVDVHSDSRGHTLRIDGVDTMLFGMNWDYVPVGENYSYDFWRQPRPLIERVLRRDMALLRDMGVNSIRQYPGMEPEWIEWIYDEYGITTMINPLVGRYGVAVDGRFIASTPYGDPKVRQALIDETMAVVERYKNTRGVVMFLLGNEANYGLEWTSFEIQALPKEDRDLAKATALYSLYGEIVDRIHAVDPAHPVAICNGDLGYIDVIAEQIPNLDLFGTNVYRGASARDLYAVVEEKLGVPIFYTEFGADAYHAREEREDALTQARYLHAQWQEVYEQSYGKGGVGNAIGGYVFQWSDGWWKFRQEENLDVHDPNASWPNEAYREDFVDGGNNMNEEWFGITAKTPPDPKGFYELQPRTAYWMLKEALTLDPYAETTTVESIREHFAAIDPADYEPRYEASRSAAQMLQQKARLKSARVELSTFVTGGSLREGRGELNTSFDHGQSVYLEGEVKPAEELVATATVNVLGRVPQNRIDTIFFENRGNRGNNDDTVVEGFDLANTERVKLYNANVKWTNDHFDGEAFYRTGHYHWGYQGDFFGLYQEANIGFAADQYNADVPIGVEVHGKKQLQGLSLAVGPQIYWGANPQAILKYYRQRGKLQFGLLHHEDIAPAPASANVTSVVIAEQLTRRTTAYLGLGKTDDRLLELGGIWGGTPRIGQAFTAIEEAAGAQSYNNSGYDVIDDVVRPIDTLGAKARLHLREGPFGLLVSGQYKGLVADGGPDPTVVLTGWSLKESGRGNQMSGRVGAVLQLGHLTIAPNALAQKPLVGPNTPIADSYDPASRFFLPAVSARNVIDDPFAVLDNRETYAAEMLLVWDPTPGSFFFAWNNEEREDAPLAASLDVIYRHQPTVRDANFGFTQEGVLFAFDGSPPAADVWDVNGRLVFGQLPLDATLMVQPYVGQAQANGIDPRLVLRKGVQTRLWIRSILWDSWLKLDDWGPYDFHRDFNLTFPVQVTTDFSGGLGRPRLYQTTTRIGVIGKYRTLDAFSPDMPAAFTGLENEFEIATYIKVAM